MLLVVSRTVMRALSCFLSEFLPQSSLTLRRRGRRKRKKRTVFHLSSMFFVPGTLLDPKHRIQA